MAGTATKLDDFVKETGAALEKEFNAILASYNPPRPLRVESLLMKGARDHVVVYEDEECIILMET